MPDSEDILRRRRENRAAELYRKGRYHSLELPDGRVLDGLHSVENLRRRYARFGLPEDLRGMRALDIGAWDGWFSFELERRGAEVVAIDCVEIENFVESKRILGSKVDYRIMEFYDLSPRTVGYFDIVLCLGVLYHLKHPLLALERVCELTRETAVVETFVVNDGSAVATASVLPAMEFYETNELGEQWDNWCGPSLECLTAMARTAGFCRVDLQFASPDNACVRCWRRWEPAPAGAPRTETVGVNHYRNFGINFGSDRDDYVNFWFRDPAAEMRREDVMPSVSGFGSMPMSVKQMSEGVWAANFKLPPGLAPGWHETRIRTRWTSDSEPLRIAVDVPLPAAPVVIRGVCDGRKWTEGVAYLGPDPCFCLWLDGLPENADRGNIKVEVSGRRFKVVYVGEIDSTGYRQVNVKLDPEMEPGVHQVVAKLGGTVTEPAALRVERPA